MGNDTEKKKVSWTKSQEAAIRITDKTLLVSAAAGSGKTATLTERVIRSITEGGADISKMLIVTFTRAAAAELRARIFSALSDALAKDPSNTNLNNQLIKLGSATICTIDSFYFSLVRQNFSVLGISATQRIGDNSELDLIKANLIEEAIADAYEKYPDFPSFVDTLVRAKSDSSLSEMLLNLYDTVTAYPSGLKFLKDNADTLRAAVAAGGDVMSTPYGKVLRVHLKRKLQSFDPILREAYDVTLENYPDTLAKRAENYDSDRHEIIKLCSILDSCTYEEIRDALQNHKLTRFNTPRKGFEEDETTLFYKELRKKFGGTINSIKNDYFYREPASLCEVLSKTADFSEMLYSMFLSLDKKYSEEKARRGVMDFTEVRRLAHDLLVKEDGSPTDFALTYRERYTHVYIDEYQDVDKIQDEIFCAISDNRFMVGDIKQSIYCFRNADPGVFANYKSTLPLYNVENPNDEEHSALSLFMSENFRCDKPIIDFTNLVCGRLFSASADSIGYTVADDLRFSKKQDDIYEGYVSDKVKVAVILTENESSDEDSYEDEGDNQKAKKRKKKKKDPNAPDPEELEAMYIASQIHRLIGKEKRADGKLIGPGDIAIIYRTGTMVPYLTEALARYGIRCSEGGGDSYFENPDVLLVLSLLNVVDNPHRDIHLAGVLCSPLYDFTFDDLITIRTNADNAYSLYDALLLYAESGNDALAERCRGFGLELERLRTSSIALPVDRFLRLLFESDIFIESGLLADRDSFGDGGNLLQLYDYARSFESGSFRGLYNFIEFINSLIDNNKKLQIAKKASNENIVTLTTMHHSKGLEYPVCFICGAGRSKNMKGLKSNILYDRDIGLAMKLSDPTGFARIKTLLHRALYYGKYLSEIEEEMRILYVAMTRAREKLFITATSRATEEELLHNAYMRVRFSSAYSICECQKFLHWLLIPFADKSLDVDCAELRFISPAEILACGAQEPTPDENAARAERDEKLFNKLVKDMGFVYPYTKLEQLPSKLSVSRLYPDMLDADEGSAEITRKEERASVPSFFISGSTAKASSAERGTATHLFFQFCDFARARRLGIRDELDRLVSEGFIPDNIASIVYENELEKFLDSELSDRIFAARETIRERRFNILLPADAFVKKGTDPTVFVGENIAAQGVIDLILIDENGDIELYDYKTDRLSRDELSDDVAASKRLNSDHGLQLSYYAYAVEALFERKCKRVCIYSTHSGKLYDVDRVPLRLK